MAGLVPSRRAASGRVFWSCELRRAAFLLAASVALFWSAFAAGRWIIPISDSGPSDGDVHISAWPSLWSGLRDLRARQPDEPSVVVAWKAFLLTLVVIVAAIIIVLVEYRAIVSSDAWIFMLHVTVFSYLSWSIVPILALHGVLFGRVTGYLEPRFRYLADIGAFVLFTVAAVTAVVVLQNPEAITFAQAWMPRSRNPSGSRLGRVRHDRPRDDRPLGPGDLADPQVDA